MSENIKLEAENNFENKREIIFSCNCNILNHQIDYNPGDMMTYYNLDIKKESKPTSSYENVPILIKRTGEKRENYFNYQKEQKDYDDSKYFDENNNPIDFTIYHVDKNEELIIYSNGDLEIKKREYKN